MECWSKVIVEWINCLDVLDTPIEELNELQDEYFYEKLLNLLPWKKKQAISDNSSIHTFIEDEYPDFKKSYEESKKNENKIYIVSLLLLHVSQEPKFQEPMCIKLKHEIQIKIKNFLEMILPYGKSVTTKILQEVIAEFQFSTPKTPLKTSPMESLKDFFNSPVTPYTQRYAIIDKTRELRRLKSELEIERYEKVDIQEDLKIQQNKVQNLLKELEKKSMEIQILKGEKNKAVTPQSCKKTRDIVYSENYYKREIDQLEDRLMHCRVEIEKLEDQKNTIETKLLHTEKQRVGFKEKCEQLQRTIEAMSIKMDHKEKEVEELQNANKDLHLHLQMLNGLSINNSFEDESTATTQFMSNTLYTSETLSSVIDVQLQEAKQESSLLKIQLENLNSETEKITKEYKEMEKSNEVLEYKVKMLNSIQAELNSYKEKTSVMEEDLKNSEKESILLKNQCETLNNLLTTKEELLLQMQESKKNLNIQINVLNNKIESLNQALIAVENIETPDLKTVFTQTKLHTKENFQQTENLSQDKVYENILKNFNTSNKSIFHAVPYIKDKSYNLNHITINELIEHLEKVLYNYEVMKTSQECENTISKSTISDLDTKIARLKAFIFNLKEANEHNLKQLSDVKENIRENEFVIYKLEEIELQYSPKCINLKEISENKQILEEILYEAQQAGINKELLLKLITIDSENTGTDCIFLTNDYNTRKKEFLTQLDVQHKNNEETLQKLSQNYLDLSLILQNVQSCKEKIKGSLNYNKSILSDMQATNNILENKISEKDVIISTLEARIQAISKEVYRSDNNMQQVGIKKEKLKIHCEIVSNETVEDLKAENKKLLNELNCTNDKYCVLEQQMCNMTEQMKVKDNQINHLLISIDNININMLQSELEDLSKEKITSETRLKEIIINLEEMKNNQNTALITQEKALEEKNMRLEQLQVQLNKLKEYLSIQVKKEKLLRINLESKLCDQEDLISKQNKEIIDLQKSSKIKRNDLSLCKEHCNVAYANNIQLQNICEDLKDSVTKLKSVCTHDYSNLKCMWNNINYDVMDIKMDDIDKCTNILDIIRVAIHEANVIRQIILCVSERNVSLEKMLCDQKQITCINTELETKNQSLQREIQDMQSIKQKYDKYFEKLIKDKENLRDSLLRLIVLIKNDNVTLTTIKEKWNNVLNKFKNILGTNTSMCDELKQMQLKKMMLEKHLSEYSACHYRNIEFVNDILWKTFFSTEQNIFDIYLQSSTNVEENLLDNILQQSMTNSFLNEKTSITLELEKSKNVCDDIVKFEKEIESLSGLINIYENNFKCKQVKQEPNNEKKLQIQIESLLKEKKELKDKLDVARARSIKLEKNLEDVRLEVKKIKSESLSVSNASEVQNLKKEIIKLKENNLLLCKEKDKLQKEVKECSKQVDFENHLKDIHNKYKLELDEMKQKMKVAYNEQIAKLTKEQEKTIKEKVEILRLQLEQQYSKHIQDKAKYETHANDLNLQFWSVAEKLLFEQQQKQAVLLQLAELKKKCMAEENNKQVSLNQKVLKSEPQEISSKNNPNVSQTVVPIKETTYEQKHNVRSMQAMVNAFHAEDEEGEVFDNNYLADMKKGRCLPIPDLNRLSILQMRNSLCKPHLKSSYPAETQFQPHTLTEEEIKTGSLSEEIFNDSLSQSLLPEQKPKKKDRSQPSYKKPGPPTPSKNGGRLSLQGNELRSPNSRILKERNIDRRVTATPRRLKSLFNLKRQDENVSGTPRNRRLSNIFRKTRVASEL